MAAPAVVADNIARLKLDRGFRRDLAGGVVRAVAQDISFGQPARPAATKVSLPTPYRGGGAGRDTGEGVGHPPQVGTTTVWRVRGPGPGCVRLRRAFASLVPRGGDIVSIALTVGRRAGSYDLGWVAGWRGGRMQGRSHLSLRQASGSLSARRGFRTLPRCRMRPFSWGSRTPSSPMARCPASSARRV